MIKKIHNQTFDSVVKNISTYCDLFLLEGVLYFKKINLSTDEQFKLMNLLSKFLNFNIFGAAHKEDHRHTFNRHQKQINSDQFFIEWHIENLHKDNPETIASWSMDKCIDNNGVGDTLFINMELFYQTMPKDWQLFLKDIKIKSIVETDENGKFLFNKDLLDIKELKAVVAHPVTKQYVLRIPIYNDEYIVSSYKNRELNNKEINMMNEIKNYIKVNISENKNITDRVKWDQGDLVIVDLFKMAHAVYGGFSIGDRVLSRIWGYHNV